MRSDWNTQQNAEKSRAAVRFLLSACWIAIALMTSRTLLRVLPQANGVIAHAFFDVVLLFGGLYWIGFRTVPNARPLSTVGFVRRPTQWNEFGAGVAVGWSVAILCLLPILLTHNLQTAFVFDGFHIGQMLLGIVLLTLVALAAQMIFFGLAFRSLVLASSPTIAAAAIAIVTSILLYVTGAGGALQALFAGFASFLFSVGALRTRAIWLPLGLQMGWGVAMTLLFGISSSYWPEVNGPVQSVVRGSRWLTGDGLGPEASFPAFLCVAAGLALVWRVTREYAWHYAFDPIVGAGYPMDIAPPAEHTRMEEQEASKPAPLVQIQGLGNAGSAPAPLGQRGEFAPPHGGSGESDAR